MKSQIALLAIAIAYAASAPTEHKPARSVRTVDLKYAVNRTVCPIVVEVDYNEARIPKAIKTIKCAPARTRHCCNTHGHARSACTELRDDVMVQYPKASPTTVIETISVGCVCMLQDYAEGNTTPDPTLPG